MSEINREREINALMNEIEIKNSRIADLKGEIASLGFFKKGQKKELEKKLAQEMEGLAETVKKYQEAMKK